MGWWKTCGSRPRVNGLGYVDAAEPMGGGGCVRLTLRPVLARVECAARVGRSEWGTGLVILPGVGWCTRAGAGTARTLLVGGREEAVSWAVKGKWIS